WSDVIGAIGGISTGKKWASGEYLTSFFMRETKEITISLGLDFTPSIFFVELGNINRNGNNVIDGAFASNLIDMTYAYTKSSNDHTHVELTSLNEDEVVMTVTQGNLHRWGLPGDTGDYILLWYAFE